MQLQKQIEDLEKDLLIKEGLPHLFLFKWYSWAREFFESTNRENFLCAANQVSKSSTQIRKCIEWAGNKELWPKLWPTHTPNAFWYFYPTFDVATSEFTLKWLQFLPRGEFKSDPEYGWEAIFERKQIKQIVFNSGITVYFKAYSQKIEDLQAGTVFALFADEEMPIDFLAELQFRLVAVGGYFHMVFTATLGQDYWRRVIQPEGSDEELHMHAFKKQISMYDCLYYEDGTPSHWSVEKIRRIEQRCGTRSEADRRVHGKFVVSGGLKFESFDREKNTVESHPLPKDWFVYAGVDCGSGGEKGHPAAIVFVAVAPNYRQARVFMAWRGDYQVTTALDIFEKYLEMRGNLRPVVSSYDTAAKDFYTIATSRGESFVPADKRQDKGTDMLNSLFKNEVLKVQRGDPEREKLIVELSSVLKTTPKTVSRDDLCDALRYCLMPVPWDWSVIDEYLLRNSSEMEILRETPVILETNEEFVLKRRRGEPHETMLDHIETELEMWNELYEN